MRCFVASDTSLVSTAKSFFSSVTIFETETLPAREAPIEYTWQMVALKEGEF